MAFEKYTIRQFMAAWFNDDRSLMNEDEFSIVYTEYVDTAGLFQSLEFDKVSYIHFLNNRINSIKISITLQVEFIGEFGIPYLDGLEFFKKFGHIYTWKDDVDDFLEFLRRVQLKENKYISQLEIALAELKDLRKKKNNGQPPTIKETRASFIRTLNSLGKIGFRIDNNSTTVEELAYMIKQQTEENEELKNK